MIKGASGKNIPLLVITISAVFFLPRAVSAYNLMENVCSGGECTLCDVVQVIYNIGKIVFISMSGVALILVIWFGLNLIISTGSSEKVQQAKSGLVNTIIALVIILGAWTIVNFIGWTLLGANKGAWKKWWVGPSCPRNNTQTEYQVDKISWAVLHPEASREKVCRAEDGRFLSHF